MEYDVFGQVHISDAVLCDMLYADPNLDISRFLVDNPDVFNASVKELHTTLPILTKYQLTSSNIFEFDETNQSQWFMPLEYSQLDIAHWVLERCKTQDELQRCGEELLLFQERNLFPMLRYLKYLVDTMRANKILWGVGRGSSVASYVLYLIGIHKINSLFYELPIEEFLK